MSSSSSDNNQAPVGGDTGFNKFLEQIGADKKVSDQKKEASSDDDMILFRPKLKNLREDTDVQNLLQGGVFQNIDKQRKEEGQDQVTSTIKVESDKDLKFK